MTNHMTPFEIASQAYDKDFRWWFLALLVCAIVGGVSVIRYLVVRAEKSEKSYTDHVAALVSELASSREHHQARMETLTQQAFKVSEQMSVVIAQNTIESREVRNYLERERLKRE